MQSPTPHHGDIRTESTIKRHATWLLGRLALAGTAIVVVAAVLEIGVRVFIPSHVWQVRDAARDWRTHERLGWVQQEDLDAISTGPDGRVIRFRTNGDGLRPWTARRERSPGVVRILMIGDSTVVGRAVAEDEAVHSQLEAFLASLGFTVEVLNAGVEGYSTDQNLIRLELLLPVYRPDFVIHGLCANDLAGIKRQSSSGLSKPRFSIGAGGGLVETPPVFDQRMRGAAAWPVRLLHRSAIYGFLHPKLCVLRATYDGVERRLLLGITDEMYYDPAAMESIDWKLFAKLVERMQAVCSEQDATFLMYAAPDPLEVWDPFIAERLDTLSISPERFDRFALEERLGEIATALQMELVPIVAEFVKRQDRGPFHLLPADRHCNAAGYRLTARILAHQLTRLLKTESRTGPSISEEPPAKPLSETVGTEPDPPCLHRARSKDLEAQGPNDEIPKSERNPKSTCRIVFGIPPP